MNSLKKGNLQSVTLLSKGGEMKGFIEANPQSRNINIYNLDGTKQLIQHKNRDHQKSLLGKQPNGVHRTIREKNKSKGIKR